MNRIHSKVWNRERGQIVVASEFAKGDSAGVVQGAGAVCRKLLAVALAPLLALAGSIAFAQDMDLGPGGSLTIGDVVVDGGGVAIGGAANRDRQRRAQHGRCAGRQRRRGG